MAVWELKPKKKKMQLPAAASLPIEQAPGHATVCTLGATDGSTVVYVAAGDESSAHVWQCFPQSGQQMTSETRAAFRLQNRWTLLSRQVLHLKELSSGNTVCGKRILLLRKQAFPHSCSAVGLHMAGDPSSMQEAFVGSSCQQEGSPCRNLDAWRCSCREQEAQSDGILALHLQPTAEGVSLLLARGTTLKPHFQRFPISSRSFVDVQLEPLEVCCLFPIRVLAGASARKTKAHGLQSSTSV